LFSYFVSIGYNNNYLHFLEMLFEAKGSVVKHEAGVAEDVEQDEGPSQAL
jgi:hypothetical protein